jgi:hypothetical protein
VEGDHIKWDMDFKKDSIKGFPNLAQLSFAKTDTPRSSRNKEEEEKQQQQQLPNPKKFPK